MRLVSRLVGSRQLKQMDTLVTLLPFLEHYHLTALVLNLLYFALPLLTLLNLSLLNLLSTHLNKDIKQIIIKAIIWSVAVAERRPSAVCSRVGVGSSLNSATGAV